MALERLRSGGGDVGNRRFLGARLRDPERRIELIATALMSVAVVLSAYRAWQATRRGGVQATAFAEASTLRTGSAKAQATANSQLAYDASAVLQLILAYTQGNTEAALELKVRFLRKDFKPYVDEWLAIEPFQDPTAPATPFDVEGFTDCEQEKAKQLDEQASVKVNVAKDANQTGDDLILATVYFATVLFF